ncbi:type I-G CRISPR-associated RAMP protein Csb1/Cas7g [Tuwongella immobilis]|uniref:Type I-U CRISPR-associated protein Cas7 n=1 Tax=Tuwongella immobilis TaxID=692036 RepID=A0A6C2YSS1_9BACT|nr:type I-U CRISPR-associated RAMP protein Csb1/Cas7u [Tuwongella immobilis]VIP04421.1 CRISPR-associated protein GSU0053 OS=Haliangium ochraceum (strain DSM 14365 / JCM 11303 / SMP-2) GN=Hoch_4848 PE=4 SV=1: Cas_GSU0053 [Tuwongella immobilis]VTS06204.1 CRISPR-associated protein GSU0053 OS=Haliangium ochraceum (strain DSM 14365 / JCM 11303 / SMP-2) GN=Hoch_4848 PE=4 SV=1: Cas_GSU0053 [Tuwongella immobilis]
MSNVLNYTTLKSCVAGSDAAFRLTLELEAISPKVFPPTYEGGKYATEERILNGVKIPCVLLDSVPSQANRMELALQEAIDGGLIEFPLVSVDFSAVDNPGVPKVTSLQAPHRIVDAILRDSTYGDGKTPVKFRESQIGKELDRLSTGYATPLLTYSPHSLVFGMWDSTGPRGGLGVKFARAVVSEIIGINAVPGVTTASRIDPLNIRVQAGKLYRTKDGWSLDPNDAIKEKSKPVLLGKDGKPSEANHGNVTPSISDGSFTIDSAEQTTVLSLPALRRLRFPAKPGEKSSPESDIAARSYLAALGLLGATLAVESGYDLRSRCLLHAKNEVVWQLVGKPGAAAKPFTLDKESAIKLYQDALQAVQKAKLPIHLEEIVLKPTADLVELVKKSMELAAAEAGEGE